MPTTPAPHRIRNQQITLYQHTSRTSLDFRRVRNPSQDAFDVLERRIYALENPTVIGPDRLREPPDRRRER